MTESSRLKAWLGKGGTGLLLAAVATAGCGGRSTAEPVTAPGCRIFAGEFTGASPSYSVAVDVGPPERMYTPEQAAAEHPVSGEIMIRGTMAMVEGSDARHLEVHICSRRTGQVVSDALPTITIADSATPQVAQDVPVALMEGVGSGQGDLHYGNNVAMVTGHTYIVTVRLRGEQIAIKVAPPS